MWNLSQCVLAVTTYIGCTENKSKADKCIIHSFRAFGHSTILWEHLLKRPSRLQAISSHFTDLVKKKKIFKQACAVHLVFTGSHPKMHFQTHMSYLCLQFCVLVMSIIHIWFSALSSKRKMSKNNRFCRAKKAYLLLHAVCWKYKDGL